MRRARLGLLAVLALAAGATTPPASQDAFDARDGVAGDARFAVRAGLALLPISADVAETPDVEGVADVRVRPPGEDEPSSPERAPVLAPQDSIGNESSDATLSTPVSDVPTAAPLAEDFTTSHATDPGSDATPAPRPPERPLEAASMPPGEPNSVEENAMDPVDASGLHARLWLQLQLTVQ